MIALITSLSSNFNRTFFPDSFWRVDNEVNCLCFAVSPCLHAGDITSNSPYGHWLARSAFQADAIPSGC